MSKKLIALLLSAAMTFSPMLSSMPAYAAEIESEAETLGVMPEADTLDDVVSDDDLDNGDTEEAADEEQTPKDTEVDDLVEDDVDFGEESKNGVSDVVNENDANAEEKTETKTETTQVTEPKETISEPVYEEVMEEESESAFGSEEESESESEEMSQEEVRASFSITVSDVKAGGWNESIYVEIPKVTDVSAITEVSWTGTASGKLDADGLKYLVRTIGGNGTRIDIPGLKAGTYDLSITVSGSGELKKTGIEVYEYDRSGFAHFNTSEGVGAYNNDGTLKKNAVVLYVTDENKNDVELTVGNITVTGIGNILNSVGQDVGGGKTSNGGVANSNKGIIKELAKAGKPLVVRFIGTVSDSGLYKQETFKASSACKIEGLTTYSSVDNGGTVGDNGHMARIQSGKDVTLEGIGYDAVIDGWGFHYIAQTSDPTLGKSFEVRNLTFINTPEDAIGMEGQQASKNAGSDLSASVEHCWIHHNEFYCPHIDGPAENDKAEGDGSVDFKRGQYFTCSYNYFDSCHKTNLVGSADYSLQFNLTYHHNYWYMCKARGPLTRRANVHMYNNVWDMQTDYAQNTRADAYIFSEYNIFYACKSPQAVEAGAIKSYNDTISSVIWNKGSAGTIVTDKSEYVSNNCQFSARGIKYDKFDTESSQSYIPDNNYQLQTDFAELRRVIIAQTGVQERNPKRPDAVQKSEYSVVDRMVKATNANVNTYTSLPQELAPGKISKSVYAFEVGAAVDIEVTYNGAPGVLVNEEGENLLTGDGSVINLPAGKYMIQAENFQPGNATKGTIAVFKDFTISSLKISQHDPNAHYHNWVLDPGQSKDATCTEDGEKVYKCDGDKDCDENRRKVETIPALGHSYTLKSSTATCTEPGTGTYQCSRCDATYEGDVPARGHSWGAWQVTTPATADTEGEEQRVCTRDGSHIETKVIPPGGTGSGNDNPGGNVTVAGDYELYFTGKTDNGDKDFFTYNIASYTDSKGTVTVNGTEYKEAAKFGSTSISFSCNEGATLFMAFADVSAGKKITVDGQDETIGSDGTITMEMSAGKHTIGKTSGNEVFLFYLSVANGASDDAVYTIWLEYNYDDSPDAWEISAYEGMVYSSMTALVPASFTRRNHNLSGLYEDADCTTEITFPYVVNGNAILYADWVERDVEDAHSLIFQSNGGSAVSTVTVSASQIYTITQKPTKDGYIFAGWYDALEGGNLISSVDGSKMTGNMTVYAHWNDMDVQAVSLELNCATDLAEYVDSQNNITQKTTINGFTIHVLPGGVGTAGSENPKYYMTTTTSGSDNTVKLGTNGVLLTDVAEDPYLKSIEFTTKGEGTLIVEVELSAKGSTGSQYDIVLARQTSDGLEVVSRKAITSIDPVKKEKMEFPFDEAGTYYVYPEGAKGVRYSSLKVTEPGYTILYHAGVGTVPEGLTSVVKAAGTTVDIPGACTPAPGYTFKGWSIDGTTVLQGTTYTVKEEDAVGGVITMTALYDAQSFTVKYDANGGTLPAGAQDTSAVVGNIINLEHIGNCTPPPGYEFKGWKVGDRTVKTAYTVNATDADENGVIILKAEYVKAGTGGGNPNPSGKNGIVVVLKKGEYLYTGDKIIPEYDVIDYEIGEGKLLLPGVDYTVTYKNNKDISTDNSLAQIIIKGKGNYAPEKGTGNEVIAEFKIIAASDAGDGTLANIKGAKIEKIDDVYYDGNVHNPPTINLRLKGKDEPEVYQYNAAANKYEKADGTRMDVNIAVSNNCNKGNATVLVSGVDDKGKPVKIKSKFKIKPVDLSQSTVTITPGAAVYSPKGAVPETITVICNGTGLELGKDYTVKYSNNKNAGTGSITVTGKGNYTKKVNLPQEYSISKATMANFKVAGVSAPEGKQIGKIKATVVDKKNGNALNAKQYELKFYKTPDGTEVYDETEVIAKDMSIYVAAAPLDTNNLEGTEETERTEIKVGIDISKAKFTLTKGLIKGYTGSEVYLTKDDFDKEKTTIKVDGKTQELTMGTDFEIVSYENNINKGTATAIIAGKGDYSGTKTIKFKIGQQTIKKENVTVELEKSVKEFGNRILDSISIFN